MMILAASTRLRATSAQQNDGEKQTMTDETTDHYSSRSVRLSSDTTNIGSNERKILIENDYEVTYGTYFKIVRMKCGFDHARKNPGKCTKNTYVLRKRGTDVTDDRSEHERND